MSSIADRYDEWHAAKTAVNKRPSATAPWHQMAKPHVGNVAGLRVLEIGCGRGAFAEFLADRGANLVAADLSPEAVRFARETLGERVECVVADIERIPFPDQSFDLVVSLETVEHATSPKQALAELVRVTKRRGRLIVTTPSYLNLIGVYRVYLRLRGRRFTEGGQPTSQPVMLHSRVWRLKRLGCEVTVVEGRPPPKLNFGPLEKLPVMKWCGLRSLTVAVRR
jgi:2-polyprenyl-3-methyl-5-hydroxy-6-metoxy-1,4-benzoquinol methylase